MPQLVSRIIARLEWLYRVSGGLFEAPGRRNTASWRPVRNAATACVRTHWPVEAELSDTVGLEEGRSVLSPRCVPVEKRDSVASHGDMRYGRWQHRERRIAKTGGRRSTLDVCSGPRGIDLHCNACSGVSVGRVAIPPRHPPLQTVARSPSPHLPGARTGRMCRCQPTRQFSSEPGRGCPAHPVAKPVGRKRV